MQFKILTMKTFFSQFFLLNQFLLTPKSWTAIVRFLKSWTMYLAIGCMRTDFCTLFVWQRRFQISSMMDYLKAPGWIGLEFPNLWLFKSLEINQKKLSDRRVENSVKYEFSNVISGRNCCHRSHSTVPRDRKNVSTLMKLPRLFSVFSLTCTFDCLLSSCST